MKFFFAIFFLFTFLTSIGQKLVPVDYTTADSLFKLGSYDEAKNLLLNLMLQKLDDSVKAEVFLRYGTIQPSYNKIDSGIYYIKAALSIFEIQKNNIKTGRCLQNIGDFYSLKKNYAEAEVYLKKSLSFYTLTKDSVKSYISILVLHLRMKDYENANALIKNTLNNFPQDIIPYQKYYIEEAKGLYLNSKNKYDSAIVHFKLACNAAPDESFKIVIFNNIAETYTALKNYNAAFIYQDSAASLGKNIGWAEDQGQYDNYARLYEETGNFKKALYYSKLSRHLSDSFFDIEKNNALLDAEAKYQNEKTKAEKALVEKDNIKKNRNLILSLIGLGLVALLAFLGLRSARSRKKANLILATQKQAVQNLADELNIANNTKARLFSTISHDLRGPLSTLYAHVKLNELKGNTSNDAGSKQTTQLLDTLEELLVWSKSQMDGFVVQKVNINMHTFFEELIIFYAISINKKKINIFNNINPQVFIKTDENILKTICRNLISNAISNINENENIIIDAFSQNDKAYIIIKNTCTKNNFEMLVNNFENENVKSNANGYGIVLIKEFTKKLNATIELDHQAEQAEIKINFM
jgi:signal transduction histidine kinase